MREGWLSAFHLQLGFGDRKTDQAAAVPAIPGGRSVQRIGAAMRLTSSEGASDIEAEANCQIGAMTHTIRESCENFTTLLDGKSDDQYPVLGLGKQFAQHDAGVARRAGNIRSARHQLGTGTITARLPLPPRQRRSAMLHAVA